jgi:hypothetical protein
MRLVTEKSLYGWYIYKVNADDTKGECVGEIYDQTLLTILLHAPAQAIIDKVLTQRRDHHLPKRDRSLQSFQEAFMNILRKL